MNDENAIVKAEQVVEVPQTYFIATSGEEMVRAQSGLTAWVTQRLAQAKGDLSDARLAYNAAVERKWAAGALKRQMERARHLVTYYQKMVAALEAGYVLVPEFPIDVFAIRTSKERPRESEQVAKGGNYGGSPEVHGEMLPIGEGDYKSSKAERLSHFSHRANATDYQGKEIIENGKVKTEAMYKWTNDAFRDVTFPLVAAKLEVMSPTAAAMALKVFDEIGISVKGSANARTRTGDPLIIGAIHSAGATVWSRRTCHFLIAWFVDTRAL